MTYQHCERCDEPMIGIKSHSSRKRCHGCGGKALLTSGSFTSEEREALFAYAHTRSRKIKPDHQR